MWREELLGNLCIPRKGRNTDLADGLRDGYLPYLGAGQIAGDPIDKYASVEGGVSCKDEDVLILWDGERSGLVGFGRSGVVSSTAAKLVVNERIDSQYLYYFLSEQFAWIQNQRTGTGVPHVPKDLTKRLFVRYPDSELAQKKIAKILKSSDFAIERTKALIAKYENIKQGMMQELFTRGVDENGQLRSSYEDAPHLYQETWLGCLPKSWKLERLESLLDNIPSAMRSGPFGSALLKSELTDEGYPLLGIDNVFQESFSNNFKRFVSQKKFNQLYRYRIRPRDVIITIMGTVGRCCVVPENTIEALSSKHLWTMTFDKDKVLPELICWQLNYAPWVMEHFRRYQQGGVMDAIQSSVLKNTLFPIPDLDEQQIILEQYQTTSTKIQKEKETLNKLLLKKAGLMQDLLTGKVRVAEDVDERKEAVA